MSLTPRLGSHPAKKRLSRYLTIASSNSSPVAVATAATVCLAIGKERMPGGRHSTTCGAAWPAACCLASRGRVPKRA